MRRGAVDIALAHLEVTGNILRGRFTPGRDQEEFCDRRILARIHRETIARMRRMRHAEGGRAGIGGNLHAVPVQLAACISRRAAKG